MQLLGINGIEIIDQLCIISSSKNIKFLVLIILNIEINWEYCDVIGVDECLIKLVNFEYLLNKMIYLLVN